jgi:glycosyltransferase involved in cell wall biosynthesis
MSTANHRRMRTLFISNALPYPLNVGGNLRLYHILVGLSRVSDVTMVCPVPSGDCSAELQPLRRYAPEIVTYPLETVRWTSETRRPRVVAWARSLARTLGPTPARISLCHSEAGRRAVRELVTRSFDLVWAQRLISTTVIPECVDSRVVVDLDDVEHRKLAHKMSNTWPYAALGLDAAEFVKLRAFELSLARRPYEFTVCSEIDRAALGASANVSVLPNGVEVPSPPPAPARRSGPPTLVFVGTMDYPPNVDAVRFFAQRILPIIRHQEPAARFLVVGRSPAAAVRQLHDGERIVVTGTVPSVLPHLEAATAVVAPIRFGGGTRIKILEAFARRRAVVATRVGAEGIDGEHGRHLLLADEPLSFAEACVSMIRDVGRREALADAGYRLAARQYDWAQIEARVGTIAFEVGWSGHAGALAGISQER